MRPLPPGDSKMATAVAEFILPDLEELPTKTLLRYLPQIFPVLARLVTVPSPEAGSAPCADNVAATWMRDSVRWWPPVAQKGRDRDRHPWLMGAGQEVERSRPPSLTRQRVGEKMPHTGPAQKVSYAVTLKGRWRAQERPHVPLELLRAPLQVGEPVELWSRSDGWLLAEVEGLEASTALLRHYKVRVFGQEAVAVVEASYLRRRFLKGSAVEVYRGPARGWICTRVSDMDMASGGGPGFTNRASSLDAVTDGFAQADGGHPEPPAELCEPQSGADSRRGAPPRKSDGSRFQPCDFVATVPVLKEFAVSDEDVEEVPSFLLRPAASSPSCPSQVFQI
ncbi:unnamed protein product [Symbiodinium sp. CCMP2456]|nr:unnamed protein product [Symbiodinium sp. CCMP2456]